MSVLFRNLAALRSALSVERDKCLQEYDKANNACRRDSRKGTYFPFRRSRGRIIIGPEPTRTPEQREYIKRYQQWKEQATNGVMDPVGAFYAGNWDQPVPRPIPRDRFGEGDFRWDGTKKQLEEAIRDAIAEGYDELYIEEGFDAGLDMAAFSDGSYEPWVTTYDVKVWAYDGLDTPDKIVWGAFENAHVHERAYLVDPKQVIEDPDAPAYGRSMD